MPRRKGKSEHRRSDWQQRYLSGETDAEDSATRTKLTSRAVKLPPSRLAAPRENLDNLPKTEGMVVGLFPGGTVVRAAGEMLLCGVAKTFRAPPGASALAVGDEVTVALTRHADASGSDKDRADGMIIARQTRRTVLSRPAPRSAKRNDPYETEAFEKVIVANMDVLLIVAATRQPALRHGLIDRFLIMAERGDLKPVLVISKIDLGEPDEHVMEDLTSLGIDIHRVSAVTREGLDRLYGALAGKRSVLAGASGVGKSTLINAMIAGAQAATQPVRMRDERGRHTTAAAAVYDVPPPPGPDAGTTPMGLIVDTPGVREMGVQLSAAELPWYFPEIEEVAPRCHFNDCTHTHEPGCAVAAAVETGAIQPRRYESYLRILETIEDR